MNTDTLSVTERYFALSNQADLIAIESMFHPLATYSSANTGLYFGINDIMQMMRLYFSSFHALKWQIDSIEALNKYITEVHFTSESTNLIDMECHRTKGVERLVVVDALIRHIEVT